MEQGELPFRPTQVGRYWDRHTEVDVIAINPPERALLMGEARYTSLPVGRDVLDGLQDKAARLAPTGWQAHLALFLRSGFTANLATRAAAERLILADLEQIIAHRRHLAGQIVSVPASVSSLDDRLAPSRVMCYS